MINLSKSEDFWRWMETVTKFPPSKQLDEVSYGSHPDLFVSKSLFTHQLSQ